jgi:hypothetical protein
MGHMATQSTIVESTLAVMVALKPSSASYYVAMRWKRSNDGSWTLDPRAVRHPQIDEPLNRSLKLNGIIYIEQPSQFNDLCDCISESLILIAIPTEKERTLQHQPSLHHVEWTT